MSTSDFLFAGSTPASFTSATDTNTSLPDWYQDASKALITQASAVAGTPYQTYSGPTVAPLTDTQNTAVQGALNSAGSAQGVTGQGADSVHAGTSGSTPLNESSFNSYLQPYTDASSGALDTIAKLGTRNLTENILPAVNQGFIANGMFGSTGDNTGQQTADERAIRDANESILNQQSSLLSSNINNAMSAYQGANALDVNAGGVLGTLGSNTSAENVNDYNTLTNAGALQQGNQQANLNAAYTAFQNQTNYPTTQLNELNSIIHGYAPPASTTATQTTPYTPTASNVQPSGATALTGALSQLLGNG